MNPGALIGLSIGAGVMCFLLKRLLVNNRWPRLLPWVLTLLVFGIVLGPYVLGAALPAVTLVALFGKPSRAPA